MQKSLSISSRPTNFNQVIGYANIVATIKGLIANGRLPNVFVFTGEPGYGKTTLAKIVARYIQDDSLPDDVEPEVIELNAADTNGVDDARDLAATSEYAPIVGKYRVIILDEAQKLTEAAQNCLLKPMESASSPTVWIVCTTDSQKILPAIRSRASGSTFHLRGLDSPHREKLVARLINGLPNDPKALLAAMDKADLRSPRAVVNAVEMWLAGASPADAIQVSEERPEYNEIIRTMLTGNWDKTRAALSVVRSKDVGAFRGVLSSYLNSLLVRSETGLTGSKESAVCTLLKNLALYHAYEDSVTLGAVGALMCEFCRKVGQ